MQIFNTFKVAMAALLTTLAGVSEGASVSIEAECSITVQSISGSSSVFCDRLSGPVVNGELNVTNGVTLLGPIEASYGVTVADFGHFGAGVQTYALGQNAPFGTGIASGSALSLTYRDTITVTSSTLPQGSLVPINMAYRVDGFLGVNYGEPGAYQNNVEASARGFISLGTPGDSTSAYFRSFCIFPSAQQGCATTFPGVTGFSSDLQEDISLRVGFTYQLVGAMFLSATSFLDLAPCSPDNFCDVGAFVNSTNSFHNYLTPMGGDFELVSESGHSYALTPIAEPSSTWMILLGLGLLAVRCLSLKRLDLSAVAPSGRYLFKN